MAFQSTGSTLVAVLLATALGACSDPAVVVPGVADNPSAVVERVQCAADVRAGEIKCAPSSSGGASRSITLGGQGTYIELTAGNSSYASGIFQADVRIRNLTNQPMGTSDGSTVAGLKAFIATGPTVTSGTGTVTVDNADGVAAFTAANQPYFLYSEILDVFSGTSSSKAWRFAVQPTVNTFTFTVLVQTTLPAEVGILRWTTDRGRPVFASAAFAADSDHVFACSNSVCYQSTPGGWRAMGGLLADSLGRTSSILGMDGSSPSNVWAVGAGGLIGRYDGVRWQTMPTPTSAQLNSVAVLSPTDVYTTGLGTTKVFHWDGSSWSVAFDVGTGAGSAVIVRALSSTSIWASTANGGLRHFNGTTLDTIAVPIGNILRGLWVVADNDVWTGATNGALFHYNGSTVTQVPSPTTLSIWGFAGFSATDIFAATGGNEILHYDGTAWEVAGTLATTQVGASLTAVSPTNIYLAGYNGSDQLYHYDGTDVTTPGAPMAGLNDIWGNSPSNVYAVGTGGTVLRYNGTTWALEPTGTAGNIISVWGNATDVWAVGNQGTAALRRTAGAWSLVPKATSRILRGVWGSGSMVWAVGDTGTIERFDGTSWSTQASTTTVQLLAVAGTNTGDVWAVGASGTILHWNGTAWSGTSVGAFTLTDVYAFSNSDAWAVGLASSGARGVFHWNGTAWVQQTGLNGPGGISCISASTPTDIWVGGGAGVMFHFDGVSWSSVATGVSAGLCPYVASSTLVFAAGSSGTVLRGTR